MSNTQKNYDEGYDLCLDLIEELGFKTKDNPTPQHFTGILSCLFNLLYVHQPKDEVNRVVSMAQDAKADEKNYSEFFTYLNRR